MSVAASSNRAVSELIYMDPRSLKHLHDNVHGNIYLEPLFMKFIDTREFQRLRDVKQLGLTHLVYPGAVHSRFEHSLGVYWLAGEAINKITACQGLELDIERRDIEAVKLAGLLHDLGQGPFGHLFEHDFMPRAFISEHIWCHEDMAVEMIQYLVDENHIDVDTHTLAKVKAMVTASYRNASQEFVVPKHFLYDIVANGRTGIDVDKFDYIVRDSRACGLGCSFQFERLIETMRVIGDEICYRAKDYLTIHKLFASRADLHRTVYAHAKVKAIELMVLDALLKANDFLSLEASAHEPDSFTRLDDTILKKIENHCEPEVQEAKELIRRIRRRDLYQFCNEVSVPKEAISHFKNITPQDIICSQSSGSVTLKEEDVAVSNVKIDLTRGRNNPLERIKFFKDYDSNETFTIQDERISHLLPTFYQDTIVRVYSTKPELVAAVSEAFENFQLKTYGIKKQVHATPEKKKRRTQNV